MKTVLSDSSLDYLTDVLGFDKDSSKQLIHQKRKGR